MPPRCWVAEAPTATHRTVVVAGERGGRASYGNGLAHVVRPGSIETTASSNSFATQEPAARTSAFGPLPTSIDASMSPVERLEPGHGPVRMVGDPDRAERRGHRRADRSHPLGEDHLRTGRVDPSDAVGAIDTHTPSGVKATPEGRPASGCRLGVSELGSTRSRAAPFESAIHRKPSPTAIPFGAEPMGSSA